MLKLLFTFLILGCSLINAANILAIFSVPSFSHQKLFRIITDALEDRGHKLTIISTNPELGRGKSTEIDLHFSYKLLDKAVFSMSVKEAQSEFESLSMWVNYEAEMMEKQLSSEQIQEFLKKSNQKFDAVILDFNGLTPWYAFAEYFKAPLIGISGSEATLELHEAMGNAANPIANPDSRYLDIVTFTERFYAWKYQILYNNFYKSKFESIYDQLIKKFLPKVEVFSEELKGKADLVFINTHPAMGYVRPLLPTTIQLGFLHVKPPQPLVDEALVKFIDSSQRPIVYVNFGTSIKSSDLQEPYLNIFRNVFKVLPYNFIWKWEKETMPDKPDNVFITPWVQQSDLLANPKIKLFINHGGQLAIEEGVARGVPMISMPFYGDQTSNSLRLNLLGVGIAVNIQALTEPILKMVITEIFTGQFIKNARDLSDIVNDEPMTPVDKAVWWSEYVIRHKGTGHMHYPGKYVPFYQKYMLDFIAIAVVLWHIFIKFVKFLVSAIFAKKVKQEEVETKKDKKKNKKKKEE